MSDNEPLPKRIGVLRQIMEEQAAQGENLLIGDDDRPLRIPKNMGRSGILSVIAEDARSQIRMQALLADSLELAEIRVCREKNDSLDEIARLASAVAAKLGMTEAAVIEMVAKRFNFSV